MSAILPEVDATTRTLKARIELKNAGGRLVPGMFATIQFAPAHRRDTVLVPSEAVIRTGKRTVVIVAQAEGRFAPIDVETGIESNGQTEIRNGVRAGDSVVVSGQFLIDSEANLKAATTRMSGMPANRASDMDEAVTGEHNAHDRHAGHDAHAGPAGHDAPAEHGAPKGHDGHMKQDMHMGRDASPRAE